ncbi:MAG: signal recognition particle-docking protein FtsY [Candidatus Nanopelagicales bacterium]|nr:signal recognition particle-docking protein FtsY [Candidatus Nanopelagicales bacterium]
MSDIALYLTIAVAALLFLVVAAVLLFGGRRGRRRPQLPLAAPPTSAPTPTSAPPEAPPTIEAPPVIERPEAIGGRLVRLRARLAGSNTVFGRSLLTLLSRSTVDADTWEQVEAVLLTADLGVGPTAELLAALETEVKVTGNSDRQALHTLVRRQLIGQLEPGMDRSLNLDSGNGSPAEGPAVIMVVGVNGTGKTTTCGKLARLLVAEDRDVVLGAADTFRAAAGEQLETWGARVGVPVVRGESGADPASVAFEAVSVGIDGEADVVIVDTAGRLHTKVGLMDELGKVKRVIEKRLPVTETLLVLDATTGQNGLIQARVFAEAVAITGVVLTKLDGTAKGGIVVAVQRELGVPVKLVGIGEGADDLAPFDPEVFIDALLDTAA